MVYEYSDPAWGIKNMQTYINSQRHIAAKAKETGATVLLSNHSEFDEAVKKNRMLAGRGKHYGGNNGPDRLSYPMYQEIRDKNQVFSGMFCTYPGTVSVSFNGGTELVGAESSQNIMRPYRTLPAGGKKLVFCSWISAERKCDESASRTACALILTA